LRRTPARRRCQRLSIDKLVKGTKWASRKHADYIYVYSGKAVVVEDTGRPEHRDIAKVRESIEMLNSINDLLSVRVVAGIVHYRRSDAMFVREITAEAGRRPPVFPANCDKQLRRLIERLLGCSC